MRKISTLPFARKSPGVLQRHENEIWYIHWTESRRSRRCTTGAKAKEEAVSALIEWRKEHGLQIEAPFDPPPKPPKPTHPFSRCPPFSVDPAACLAILRDLISLALDATGTRTQALRFAIMHLLFDASIEQLTVVLEALGKEGFGELVEALDADGAECRSFQKWIDDVFSALYEAERPIGLGIGLRLAR